jgi:hypothetical protein
VEIDVAAEGGFVSFGNRVQEMAVRIGNMVRPDDREAIRGTFLLSWSLPGLCDVTRGNKPKVTVDADGKPTVELQQMEAAAVTMATFMSRFTNPIVLLPFDGTYWGHGWKPFEQDYLEIGYRRIIAAFVNLGVVVLPLERVMEQTNMKGYYKIASGDDDRTMLAMAVVKAVHVGLKLTSMRGTRNIAPKP